MEYTKFVIKLVDESTNNLKDNSLEKFCEIELFGKIYKFDINLHNWENEDIEHVKGIFIDFIKNTEEIKDCYINFIRSEKIKSILKK